MRRMALLAAVAVLTVGCGGGGNDSDTQEQRQRNVSSVSAPWELLVVADKDWLATSGGEPLRNISQAQIPCLPQAETCFRTTTINPVHFNKSFRYYANILRADINRQYTQAQCQIAYNVYCQPQIVISLTAPDQASFAQLCEQWGERIIDTFTQAELDREAGRLRRKHSQQALRQAQEQFGATIYAPEEIDAVKPGRDFFWASSNQTDENYYNVCLYTIPLPPLTGEGEPAYNPFTLGAFLSARDSVMRRNIQGQTPGTYMSSDPRVMQERHRQIDGQYVYEVRGLWQMEHAAMGGPFVAHTHVDTLHQCLFVAEGFVFAPGKDKRTFIRRLEAALQTLQLP